ncbi:MAG: hypothetical protein HY875_13195 [Chloroflexi bacterium]|nr:hypothetical protein [Chloroflexota bacterium]
MFTLKTVSWRVVAAAAVLAAVLAGAVTIALAGDRGGNPAHRSPAELAAERLGETTPSQAAILADGVVTREEYLSAVQATVGCLAERGFTVSPEDRGDGWLRLTFATADTAEGARYKAAYQECHIANERDVALVYAVALGEARQADLATVEQSRSAIAQCLVGRGVQGVAEDAPLLKMLDAVAKAGQASSSFYQCAGMASEKYGVVPNE